MAACVSLARVFLQSGYDVALDDVLTLDAFRRDWLPLLDGMDWRVVVVLPALSVTLARSAQRAKRVMEAHSRDQHAASLGWAQRYRIDTTDLGIEDSLKLAHVTIERQGR